MTNENMTTIEINGVKMEVDLRHAKRIDTLIVGSKVKVLIKSDYNEPKVHSGIVVGFEPFKTMPTIVVCYLDINYNEASLHFAYINSKSGDKYDIVVSVDDELPIKKSDVLSKIDKEITKKEEEIHDMQRKRDFFLKHFNKWFDLKETTQQ